MSVQESFDGIKALLSAVEEQHATVSGIVSRLTDPLRVDLLAEHRKLGTRIAKLHEGLRAGFVDHAGDFGLSAEEAETMAGTPKDRR